MRERERERAGTEQKKQRLTADVGERERATDRLSLSKQHSKKSQQSF